MSWLVGLGGLVAGWTEFPSGPGQAATVAVAGVWLLGSVGVLMERDEPAFLRRWLPQPVGPRVAARVLTVCAWCQPCVWFGVASVAIRRSSTEALWVLGIGQGSLVAAAMVAALCAIQGERGWVAYGPMAALSAAGTAAWVV